MQTVTILGGGVTGCLMAAYVKTRQPDLHVRVVGPTERKGPVVGESLIEFSTHLLYQLGLGRYLEQEQLHKYGLTFYFKESPDDPGCRRYAMHEGPAAPPLPSKQLNRFTFDRFISEHLETLGVERLDAKVRDITRGASSRFDVLYQDVDGGPMQSVPSHWVIDATGRRRLLARKLELHQDVEPQRSSYWVRVRDFDRNALAQLDAVKPDQCGFDSYFCTHHFFGRGNWFWCIPMHSPDTDRMMSVGVAWRPDLAPLDLRSPEDLIAHADSQHPVLGDLLRSGTIVDSSVYRNYMYGCARLYSTDGWFIMGDAGYSVDPLYSTGLAVTSVQIEQITAMIDYERREGALCPDYARDLEHCYITTHETFQGNIGRQYEWMDSAYHSHWSVHLQTMFYFYFALPSWLAGYHTDPVGARLMTKIFLDSRDDYASMMELVKVASARAPNPTADAITNHYDKVVNWQLWGPDPQGVSGHVARMLKLYAHFRGQLLGEAGGHAWLKHKGIMARDRARAWLLERFTAGRSLVKLGPVEKFVGTGPLREPPPARPFEQWFAESSLPAQPVSDGSESRAVAI